MRMPVWERKFTEVYIRYSIVRIHWSMLKGIHTTNKENVVSVSLDWSPISK